MSLALRKDVTMAVGGFNEAFQIMEDRDLILRLRKAGYRFIDRDKALRILHMESQERFTLIGHLRRTFSYGYWWHMFSYLHPEVVGMSAYPSRLFLMSLIIMLFFYFQLSLLFVLLFPFLWLCYQIFVDRRKILSTVSRSGGIRAKVSGIIVILALYLGGALAFDVGKCSALVDKLRGKMKTNIR